jgi:UDP-hydrolysing UDP-N-acetyl-D-glucosamine 2-epimerase
MAMGEDPSTVHTVGCPSIDLAAETDLGLRSDSLAPFGGAGSQIDPEKPFVLMMQHPVTTEFGRGLDQINATLEAVTAMGMQALVFWPNVDAGSEEVAKGIREFRERGSAHGFHFFRNLPPETFVKLMAHTACMVGNSSAALREGAFLGTPAVSVGSRQQDRECGANVIFAGNDATSIAEAMREQIAHGPYERDELFGDGTAGVQIAEILATARPQIQKHLSYTLEDLGVGLSTTP